MKKNLSLKKNTLRMALSSYAILTSVCFSAAGVATDESKQLFTIHEQPLSAALNEFGAQAGLQIAISEELVEGHYVRALNGVLTAERVLQTLLNGTGISYTFVNDNTLVLEKGTMQYISFNTAADYEPYLRAYEGDENADDVDAFEIDEIIVTATKRAVSLQDVPMAITALGERNLENLGADTFADFARTVPGLTLNSGRPNESRFVIRGITTASSVDSLQSTVAQYIDDLPTLDTFASLSQPDLRLFDVNRVEILRGPQGTLFGSGAMGGAVRVITNKPNTSEFEAKTDLTLSSTKGGQMSYALNAMVNAPVIEDKLAVRAVGYYRDNGGWVDNVTLGDDLNGEEAYGGRFMVSFNPTEALSLLATIVYQKSKPGDNPAFNSVLNGKPVRDSGVEEFINDELALYNFVLEYDFDGIKLRSSTSYADKTIHKVTDRGGTPPGFGNGGAPFIEWEEDSSNFFQEVHLYSETDAAFGWFLGGFYRNQSGRNYDFSWIVPGSEALLGRGVTGAAGDDVFSFLLNTDTSEKALFGEVSYKFTDTLEAIIGARYFKNSYSSLTTSQGVFNGGLTAVSAASDDSKVTYKFLLSYTVNDDAMVYAQASQGYRVGGANVPVPEPTPAGFGADTLWNYELGAKTSWLGGKLRLNGAIYYIDWTNMQQSLTTPAGWSFIGNVGKTRSKGAELEVNAQLSEQFSYTGAFAYTDSKIQVGSVSLGSSAGDRVPGVPKYTLSNAVEYTFQLQESVEGYVRLNQQYISRSFNRFNSTSAQMGDYNIINVRLGAYVDNWEFAVFANNLFDNRAVVAIGLNDTELFLLKPRTIGLNVRTRF